MFFITFLVYMLIFYSKFLLKLRDFFINYVFIIFQKFFLKIFIKFEGFLLKFKSFFTYFKNWIFFDKKRVFNCLLLISHIILLAINIAKSIYIFIKACI